MTARKRWLTILGVVLGLPVAVVALALAVAQTGFGKRQIAGLVESAANTDDQRIEIAGLSGFLPWSMSLETLRIADREGVWLAARDIALDWSPFALIGGRLDIDRLHASAIEIQRRPLPGPPSADQSDEDGSALLLRIDIAAVSVERLTLGPALAGETATWRFAGEARVAGLDEENWLNIEASRIDGGDGLIDLESRYEGARQHLSIKLVAREGAATVNRLTPSDTQTGIDLRADIAGPLDDLDGTLSLRAGELLSADGRVRAQRGQNGTRATLDLSGRAGRMGNAPWLEVLAGDWRLQAEGLIDADTIAIDSAVLQAPPGTARIDGSIDRRDDTAKLNFALTAIAEALAPLLPETKWQSLTASGTLTGKLMQPTIAAAIEGRQIGIDEVTIGTATLRLDGSEGDNGALAATLEGALNEVALPTGEGRRLLTEATISARLARTSTGVVAVDNLAIRSPLLQATGNGRFDSAANALTGALEARAADLAAFADALDLDIAGALQLSLQAKREDGRTAVTAEASLENGKAPEVPPALIAPRVTAKLDGSLGADGRTWRIASLELESAAADIEASGEGIAASGSADLSWRIANLAAMDPQLAGSSEGQARIEGDPESFAAELRLRVADAALGAASVSRLAADVSARRSQGTISGTLAVDGLMQDKPIAGDGRFVLAADGRVEVPAFDLRWASIAAVARNFQIARTSSTGEISVKAGQLADMQPFLGNGIAGSLDASIAALQNDTLKLQARASNLRFADIAVETAQLAGQVRDPLGQAAFEATASASGSGLAGPLRQIALKAKGERAAFQFNVEGSGENARVTAQGSAALGDATSRIELRALDATYAGQRASLAGPARITVQGETIGVENLTLRAGNGTLRAQGRLGSPDGRLEASGRDLPLTLLRAVDPELQLFGTANFTATMRGALARPEIDLTLQASNMRLRTIDTAGIPPGALQLEAKLRGDAASFDGSFSAGEGNRFRFSGQGQMQGGQWLREGRLRIDGGLQLAQLAPFLPGRGRLRGRLEADLTFTASNGAIGGDGTLRIVDGRYFNYDQGIAVRDVNATFSVAGDRLQITSFAARTRSEGSIDVSGGIRVDPELTLPVDIRIVMKSARMIDRRDMQATLSSDLRLHGSVAEGMTLEGGATVERAELNLDATGTGGPEIVSLDVREINRPGGQPDDKQRKPAPPGPQVALAIEVKAPQAVFVRGRGLDVEMGGQLTIGGTVSQPRILGGLQLRRGTFSGIGRRLEFTRGSVTFPDPDRLEPVIDFTASTSIEAGDVEIAITGRPSAPKVAVSSSPPLPQDEIMAQLLFGQSTSTLSPLQLAEIGQSVGSLSGLTGSGGGILDRLRKALGFDRLGVSSNPAAAAGNSPLSGSSLELGRYVAPGVYLGAKQGATSGSTAAVVEIELTPNIKVQSEVGAEAGSKVGIGLEWDY